MFRLAFELVNIFPAFIAAAFAKSRLFKISIIISYM